MSIAKLMDGRWATRNQDGEKGYFNSKNEAISFERSGGSTRTSAGNVQVTPEPKSQYSNPSPNYTGGVYPMSEGGLVRFTSEGETGGYGDIVWLIDTPSKTLRPFENPSALFNYYGTEVPPETIQNLDISELAQGGTFGPNNGKSGYQILSSAHSIKSDGTAQGLDYSNNDLQGKYGAQPNTSLEAQNGGALLRFLDMAKGEGLSRSTINGIKNSPEQLAFYVSAMTYGGYSLGDIFSDAKAREMGITDSRPISSNQHKDQYAYTEEYQNASVDGRIAPPSTIGGLNSHDMSLGIYDLPDDAFNTLVPLLDPNSKEFKKALEKIETSYYDVMQQQLDAQTEQDKAVADYNYEEWRKETEQSLGITLSNNAIEAWSQVQSAYGDASARGIQGSGLQNEGIDKYLQGVRRQDQQQRDQTLSDEESKEMQYFLTAATSDQIRDLIASDREKAQKFGLVPSDEISEFFTMKNLKKEYPNASEEDLARYISQTLDKNGNYRSTLYQKHLGNEMKIDDEKDVFARGKVYSNAKLAEEKAYKEYTKPDVDFLRADNNYKPTENKNQYTPPKVTYGQENKPKETKPYSWDDNSQDAVNARLWGTGPVEKYTPPKVNTGGSNTGGTNTGGTKPSTGTQPTPSDISRMMEQLRGAQTTLNNLKSK